MRRSNTYLSHVSIFSILFNLLFSTNLFAATKTSNVASGNWNTAATWTPVGVPQSGDDVVIAGGHTITVDSIFVCNNLNLGNATNANATLQITSASNSLTISGDLKINTGNRNRTYILDAGPGTINVAGTFSSWSTTGTNNLSVGSGTLNITPAVSILDNGQSVTFTGAGTVNFNAAFTDQYNNLTTVSGCTVNFKSSYTVNTTTVSWGGNGTAVFWNGSSITSTTAITFNNLQTNTSASVTLNSAAGAVIIAGSMTLASGSTFTTNMNFEVGGDWTNNGGTFSGSAYTVTFNGTSNSIAGTASTTFGTVQIGRTAGTTAVDYTMNTDQTWSYFVIGTGTQNRNFTIPTGKVLTVNNDVTINQPTASSRTALLSVGAGTCNVSGNLIFTGTNATTTRVAKIDVTSGTFALTGSVTWMANTVVATEVITVSTGTITFGSSLTMATQSGTLAVTSTGTINFNGSAAPSFTFGGATTPVFTTTNGCILNFAKGFTNNTGALTLAATSQTNFTGNGTITPTTAITFGHITINAAVTATLATGSAVIVAGNVTVGSGSTFTANQGFEVGGSWTNNGGTFSGSAYTVTLNGSSNSIGGTGSTTFGTLQIGRTGGSTAVSYTVDYATTCNYLTFNGSTVDRTLAISSGITLTVNNDLTLNQPTADSKASLLSVGAGTCNVSGNLTFTGTNATVTRVAKIDVTSGTFSVSGSVTWMSNAAVETEVITVANGTLTFGTSITMGSASGTLAVTSTGTINFNGSVAPSFTFGGATSPVFTTTNGGTLNFYKGLTNTTNALTLASTSTAIFAESGTITPTAAITFGHVQINSGKTVTLGGNIALVGNWNNQSGTLTPATYGVTFNGSGSQSITKTGGETFYNLTIANIGTKTLGSNVSVSNAVVIQDAAVLEESTYVLSGTASLAMSGTSELKLERSASATYPELSGAYSLSAGTITLHQTAGTATIRGVAYYILKLTGSRPCDISAVTSIQNNFYIQGTSSITNNHAALVVGGVISYTSSEGSTLANNMTVGSFTLSSGGINDGGNTITVNGAGGWTNNGGTFTSTGTVVFTGGAAQQIAGSTATTFRTLNINNAGGVTLNVSPGAPTVVTTSLLLNDGILYTSSTNILRLLDNATSSTGSNTKYVEGPMVKVGDDNFTFPVGKAGRWRRVGVSGMSDNTTEISAEYFATGYTDFLPVGLGLAAVATEQYWLIDRTVTADPVKIRLYWEGPSYIGNCDNLKLAHWKGAQWEEEASAVVSGSYCNHTGSGSIETNGGVTSFSPFTFGDGGGSLPIVLVSFDAVAENNKVETKWITSTEINNHYFTVERSSDGVNFTTVATIPGAGNSTSMLYYQSFDENPLQGLSYYRLKQTDFDGAFAYSDVVAVRIETPESSFHIYPNPTADALHITVANPKDEVKVLIYDLSGREMYENVFPVSNGSSQTLTVQAKYLLPTGVYILSATTNGVAYKEKLFVK